MPNSIELFKKNAPELLDKVYKQSAKTAILDSDSKLIKAGANTNEIVVPKLKMDGLADYDRNSGYIDGDIELTNETVKFNYERGRKLKTDAIDNEETGGLILANLSSEFLRTKVVPEVDAVRFAQYSAIENITVEKDKDYLTGASVLEGLQKTYAKMNDDEVPEELRYLFIRSDLHMLAENVDTTKSKAILSKFAGIIEVPSTRFYTKISLLSGKDADGERIGGYKRANAVYVKTNDTSVNASKTYYTKEGNAYTEVTEPKTADIAGYYEMTEAGANDINYMVIHKPAILQYTKHAKTKIFSPDQDQDADFWKMLYRIYGLNDHYENKVAGIALSYAKN